MISLDISSVNGSSLIQLPLQESSWKWRGKIVQRWRTFGEKQYLPVMKWKRLFSVMSNYVLLRHTGKRMLCYHRHVKEHMMDEWIWIWLYRHWELECWFALQRLTILCWQNTCTSSTYIAFLSYTDGNLIEICQRTFCAATSCCFCGLEHVGEPCGFFWIELQLLISKWWLTNELDCLCWFLLRFC